MGVASSILAVVAIFPSNSPNHSNFVAACVLFDEAQNLKNITAQRTSAARALEAKVKICLTGTPLENHLGKLEEPENPQGKPVAIALTGQHLSQSDFAFLLGQ
ncbi:MAG: hypothetical protein HC883_05950 [Bdellovibrionaceae bacterium]|nr:hypothetical protein [Pseudobdellovibrionaceae bacterium]